LLRYIQPKLDRKLSIQWTTETALTTAALQCATIGIGLAWVPLSLAANAIERGELIGLDKDLPTLSMQVVAMRLGLNSGNDLDDVWSELAELANVT